MWSSENKLQLQRMIAKLPKKDFENFTEKMKKVKGYFKVTFFLV